jgi:hypothetical protein
MAILAWSKNAIMNKILTRFTPLVVLFLYSAALSAQCPPPGGGGTGTTPIDGGISALLVGAGILGYKHIRDRKNK